MMKFEPVSGKLGSLAFAAVHFECGGGEDDGFAGESRQVAFCRRILAISRLWMGRR